LISVRLRQLVGRPHLLNPNVTKSPFKRRQGKLQKLEINADLVALKLAEKIQNQLRTSQSRKHKIPLKKGEKGDYYGKVLLSQVDVLECLRQKSPLAPL
tara:strand:- start:315 stop:611 length:297 start_codon:yes stop_codon:yes gene_type:complete